MPDAPSPALDLAPVHPALDLAPVHVRIGQFALGQAPQVLKATLGSCVGIALVWGPRGRCALAHCLLPKRPPGDLGEPARYADEAVATMLRALGAGRRHHDQIRAVLGGGAQMQRPAASAAPLPQVGRLNAETALASLAAHGLVVAQQDVGGICARQVVVDCATQRVEIVRIAAPAGH